MVLKVDSAIFSVHREHTLATMGISKAGRANLVAASQPTRFSPRLSALSKEADEAELAYLLTRVSMRRILYFQSDNGMVVLTCECCVFVKVQVND